MSVYGTEVAAYLNKDTARKAMASARNKRIPACPNELSECIEQLEDPNFPIPEELRKIYLGKAHWDQRLKHGRSKRHYSVIFGDKRLFNAVSKESTFYFADGTFSTAPRQVRSISVRGSQVIIVVLLYSY